jgi:tetratricopeptide (TPR) repeat protein
MKLYRIGSLSLFLATAAQSQSIAEHMQLGDSAVKSFRPAEALQHFEAIVQQDSTNFEALWKASTNAVDLGEFEKDAARREQLFHKGTTLARLAVGQRPGDADALFHLARALGMSALSVGVRDRVRYAREIRDAALKSLEAQPNHGGSLHIMGVWNAEVMRLSGLERFLARTFLGAGFFSLANWEDATRYMERAVEAEPARLTHHLDLARVYRDRDMKEKARESYRRVIDGGVLYYNDPEYKKQAAAELAKIR